MADAKKTEVKQDTVTIKLQKVHGDRRYMEDVSVCLNGKVYLIQRGVEVEVPIGVKEILDNRDEQLDIAASIQSN